MNLPKPTSAGLQNGCSLTHCGIDLAGVPDIKAQGGVRKEPEDLRQMGNGLACRLALVHILDTQEVPKVCPFGGCIHRIWMQNDGPFPKGNLIQGVDGTES